MLFQVGPYAVAPSGLSHIGFKHADDSLALLAGNAVKGLLGLLDRGYFLNYRMTCGHRVLAHCPFAVCNGLEMCIPFRMKFNGRVSRHP